MEKSLQGVLLFDFEDYPYDSFGDDSFIAYVPGAISTKQGLLEVLNDRLKLPLYFGKNWDALEECLRDFHWVHQKNVIIVHRDDLSDLDDKNLMIYLNILVECIAFWKIEKSHQLIVVFPRDAKKKMENILGRVNTNGGSQINMNVQYLEDHLDKIPEEPIRSVVSLIVDAIKIYPVYDLCDVDVYFDEIKKLLHAQVIDIENIDGYLHKSGGNFQENQIWVVDSLRILREALCFMQFHHFTLPDILNRMRSL